MLELGFLEKATNVLFQSDRENLKFVLWGLSNLVASGDEFIF